MLAMTDLGKAARMYLMGVCRADWTRAEAVARVVFQQHSVRDAARDAKMSRSSLQRLSGRVRRELNLIVSGGHIDAADLIAKN